MKFLIIMLLSGSVLADIASVSPGEAIKADRFNEMVSSVNSLNSQMPIGTIIEVAGSCPMGFLATAGQAVSRSTYASLFSKINTEFGIGDNSTTFNLPKMTKNYLGSVRMVNCPMGMSSTSFNNYNSGSCTYTVSGEALAPEINIPGIRFSYLPAGKIVVRYAGALTNNRLAGLGSASLFRVIDGTYVSNNIVAVGAATAGDNAVISVPSAEWEIIRGQSGTNVTIQIQARVTSTTSSSAVVNSAYVVGTVDSVLSVYHYPDKEIKGNCIKY